MMYTGGAFEVDVDDVFADCDSSGGGNDGGIMQGTVVCDGSIGDEGVC